MVVTALRRRRIGRQQRQKSFNKKTARLSPGGFDFGDSAGLTR
jgi:hypothetical protein